MDEPLTVSVNEAARILGISPDTVRQMEADGSLKRLKKLRGVRFNRKAILDAAEEQEDGIRRKDYQALLAENRRLREENDNLRALFRQRLSEALADFNRIEGGDNREEVDR